MRSRWPQASRFFSSVLPLRSSQSLVATLINGVIAAVSGMFLSRFLSTVAQILIVRRLGPALFGEYAALMVSLSLFTSLLGLGLDTWLLQEGGRDSENVSQPMIQVLVLKAIAAAVLFSGVVALWSSRSLEGAEFLQGLRSANGLALVIGATGTIFESFAQTGYSALRVRRRNTLVAVFQTINPLLLVVVLLVLSRASISVLLLMSMQATFSLMMAVVVLTRIWRQRRRGIERPRLTLWPAIRQGWLFVVSEGLSNIYTQSGLAILGASAGTLVLGLFNPALNLIRLSFLVPNLMFSVGLPLIMSPTVEAAEYRRVTRLMLFGSIAYGLAAIVAIWLFGRLLIVTFYGADYAASLPYVRMMSLLPVLKACNFVWVAILLSNLRQRLRVIVQGSVVLVCLFVGWMIIPAYGAQGAAWLYIGIEALLFVLYGSAAYFTARQRL